MGHHNTSSYAKHCNPDLDLNTINGNRVNGVSESSPGSLTISRPSRPTNHRSHTQTNSPQPRLYILSSHDEEGIERQCKLYSEYLHAKVKREGTCLEDEDGVEMELLQRLSYTLASRRSVLKWRSFCIASSVAELCGKLKRGISKPLRFSNSPRLAFIFTGQGAQWHAMGRQLWAYHVYQKCLLEADAYLISLGCAWSLVGTC